MAAMKEEFETSERRYKRQLIDQEKKTHDNWMAFKNSSKTIEELKDETQLLRQQLLALRTEQREAAERAAAPLPQDRPRPPPPLPLPKGGQISLPPLPLPNGLKVGEMPSPPLVRYMESARHTPPAVVNLPSVLYQAKSSSSRHSSERREHQSQRRRDDDCGEGRGDRKSKTERVDRSDPHRVRDHDGDEMDLQRAERRREKREKQALLEKETSGNIACGDQHQHPRGPAETSAPDRDQSSSQLITAANGGGDGIGGVVKENGGSTCTSGRCSRIGDEWMTDQRLCKRADLDSNVGQNRIECCSDGRSIHSGGSKGGIISPELKKTSIQRRSDRGDHGDRGDRVERDRLEREHRLDRRDDRDERSPRGHRRR
ncbi:hypothetical protein BIW11_08353 [Tropilaelaps mercedesae]|uniref:Uncharacterized protein n=1 Tax=Tropilaelaps mercedesae TaxID=418985 RepID=A0A1V9XPV9_9ACAR|nr:hypothetical protein BIW11_08353 [Tropilaelaps mercedesae]